MLFCSRMSLEHSTGYMALNTVSGPVEFAQNIQKNCVAETCVRVISIPVCVRACSFRYVLN